MPAEKLRWAVGSIIAEGDEKPDDEFVKLFEQHGFKLFNLPAVSKVVRTTFPYKTFLSCYIYVFRVYSAVGKYGEVSVMSLCDFIELNLYVLMYLQNIFHYFLYLALIVYFLCMYGRIKATEGSALSFKSAFEY